MSGFLGRSWVSYPSGFNSPQPFFKDCSQLENILVCGTNFHARQIIRRLRKKKDVLLIGIVDYCADRGVETFMGFKIYDYKDLRALEFDKLVVAGRYVPEIVRRLLDLEISPEKIVELTRSDYSFTDEEIYERSKKTWEMLDIFLRFCENKKIKYHLAAGSVLAVLRGQNFSWFADVDIAVSSIDLNSSSGELRNHFMDYLHYTRYRTNATLREDFDRSISQIVFMSSPSDAEIEPAIIDIHSLEFVGTEARMYVGDADFITCDRTHFSDFITKKVDGRTLCLPDKAEIYLEQLYGEGWREPAERFYYSNHRTRRSI